MALSIKSADTNLGHLYPVFRRDVLTLLDLLIQATGEPWVIAEGLRSQARQLWLYAQGRTRPGPIVTWKRSPTWHGTGLAVDLRPARGYANIPHSHWTTLRSLYSRKAYGPNGDRALSNPAWENGDFGHVQFTDYALRLKALAWIRAGFPSQPVAPPQPVNGLEVYVCGEGATLVEKIEDAAPFLDEGRLWFWSRPVFDALAWAIIEVKGGQALVVRDPDEPDGLVRQFRVPLQLRQDGGAWRGYAPAAALRQVAEVRWDEDLRACFIGETAADLPARLR